jgi:bis(5'-nucleosyl)-tetraphosphatase (symmetrical)
LHFDPEKKLKMATYAIGDLQGCYKTLQALLKTLSFDAKKDKLWFVGDVVNRGADSLSCLRFIKSLGDAAITVLGNHDLHLLAVAAGIAKNKRGDTLDAVLNAPDSVSLLQWLRHRPLLHAQRVGAHEFVMVHAGMWPTWTLSDAQGYAHEVEVTLRSTTYAHYLTAMYGSEPSTWDATLEGDDRLRIITNIFTRMRALRSHDAEWVLDTKFKGALNQMPLQYQPWFTAPSRRDPSLTVIAGHWSALGLHQAAGFVGLDTGCLWGRELTAYRLEDGVIFQQENCEDDVVDGQD